MAQIAEIIKYEGDNSTFIWKHPCEDFNTTTQLIVHESQEAIFFMNGQALVDLEAEISAKVKELKTAENKAEIITVLDSLITERNKKAKLLK